MDKNKKFEVIDHTADISIRVFGKTPEEIVFNSINGLFSIVYNEKEYSGNEKEYKYIFSELTFEENIINLLNKLLYEIEVNFLFFNKIKEIKITGKKLKIVITAIKIKKEEKIITRIIKAVTYHNANLIINKEGSYQIDLVLDV
jgi:SHS2 domain-containing protein